MIYLVLIGLVVIVILLSALLIIRIYGKRYILDLNSLPKECDTVMVLGAGIRKDGKPCDILKDRLEIGAKVYLNGNCKTILLTGDNSNESRNEVDVMKAWIIDNHLKDKINEKNVILDELGVCTNESLYRAKIIYNIKKAIISTNAYHLPRAIYIARKLDIEVYGIGSDLREYDLMRKYKRREVLAQIKDFFVVNTKISWLNVKKIFYKNTI